MVTLLQLRHNINLSKLYNEEMTELRYKQALVVRLHSPSF